MKKYHITLILLALVILVAYLMVRGPQHSVQPDAQDGEVNNSSSTTEAEPVMLTQISRAVRFQYPSTYVLTEKEVGNAERTHYVISLVRASDAGDGDKGNTEGPRAITFDFYQNKEKLTPEQWVKQSSFSNFKTSPNNKIEHSQFGGKSAISYDWDGLYRGKSLVTTTSGDMLVISVTYDGDSDPRLADYQTILSTVEFVGIVR